MATKRVEFEKSLLFFFVLLEFNSIIFFSFVSLYFHVYALYLYSYTARNVLYPILSFLYHCKVLPESSQNTIKVLFRDMKIVTENVTYR